MPTPASPHFTPVSLEPAFNARREALSGGLRAVAPELVGFGRQLLRGMPFELGQAGQLNVVPLDRESVGVERLEEAIAAKLTLRMLQ